LTKKFPLFLIASKRVANKGLLNSAKTEKEGMSFKKELSNILLIRYLSNKIHKAV
jgi:hypothetical protein